MTTMTLPVGMSGPDDNNPPPQPSGKAYEIKRGKHQFNTRVFHRHL
jgi:hypothetical protein